VWATSCVLQSRSCPATAASPRHVVARFRLHAAAAAPPVATAIPSPTRSFAPAPSACPAGLQRLCGWVGVGNAACFACPHPRVARAHHIAARRTTLPAHAGAFSTHTAPMAIISAAAVASSAALAMVERSGVAAQRRPAASPGAVPPDELHHARVGLSGAFLPQPLWRDEVNPGRTVLKRRRWKRAGGGGGVRRAQQMSDGANRRQAAL
jgi:hypothetical protein